MRFSKCEYSSGSVVVGFEIVFIDEVHPVKYGIGKPRRSALFLCPCGKEFTSVIDSVKGGGTKSCGCRNDKARIETGRNKKTHGKSLSPEYHAWSRMKSRCYNSDNKDFPEYGGRGIAVAQEWREDFDCFLRDMGPRPSKDHSLDRIDVNDNYRKSNCRWALPQEQAWNQRNYKNNKSGKSGVTWNKKASRWEVRISKDGIEHYLGFFNVLEDAIRVRESSEIEMYGKIKNPYQFKLEDLSV